MSDMPPPPSAPQQWPTPPAVEPKADKPLWKKWWFIAIGVFLLLGLIGSLASPKDDDEQQASADDKPTTSTTRKPTTTTEPPTTTTTAKPALGSLQKTDDDILAAVVYSVAPYKSRNQFMGPELGKWMIVDVEVVNGANQTVEFFDSDFFLKTDTGRRYSPGFSDVEPELGGPIPEGQSARGFVAFDIPTAETPVEFGLSSGNGDWLYWPLA
jgi:hypothetical protein